MRHLTPDSLEAYQRAAPWTHLAWQAVNKYIRPTPRMRLRNPSVFDGTKPEELRGFLYSCGMTFRGDPEGFASEEAQVNYALSYLSGAAAESFENQIFNPDPYNPPDWTDNWLNFSTRLQLAFGIQNARIDAEDQIAGLSMASNAKFADHLIVFNRYAALVPWNDAALRHRLFESLPNRLQNQLALLDAGIPGTLTLLKHRASMIDHAYWARQTQIARQNARSGNRNGPATAAPAATASTNTAKAPQRAAAPAVTAAPAASAPTASSASRGPRNAPRSKMSDSERKRHQDENLCFKCHQPGHRLANCPARAAVAALRAAYDAQTKAYLDGTGPLPTLSVPPPA
jgi:hypothetical protein